MGLHAGTYWTISQILITNYLYLSIPLAVYCQKVASLAKERVENSTMLQLAQRFWVSEQGQDLTEYGLLLAFVVLAAAGIFLVNGNSLTGIWVSANNTVSQANSAAHAS